MTYPYSNGLTEKQAKELADNPLTSVHEYIRTTDGRYFAAKPRKIVWTHKCTEPHLEEVTVVFPNGTKALYCANLNNGIATFIRFT